MPSIVPLYKSGEKQENGDSFPARGNVQLKRRPPRSEEGKVRPHQFLSGPPTERLPFELGQRAINRAASSSPECTSYFVKIVFECDFTVSTLIPCAKAMLL